MITKYLEQNFTISIPLNLKDRSKEFQLNASYVYLLDSPHPSCGRNGFRKKKQILPLPQVAGSCLSHATSNYLVYTPVHSRTKARGERIDRYSITRSRAVETRGGGRREFKPLWKSSQKLISPFSVQPFSSDPPHRGSLSAPDLTPHPPPTPPQRSTQTRGAANLSTN